MPEPVDPVDIAAQARTEAVPQAHQSGAMRKALQLWHRGGIDAVVRYVEELTEAILDIDAHATPLAKDKDGFVAGGYIVTVGALHRALGKVGHTAIKAEWVPSAPSDTEAGPPAIDLSGVVAELERRKAQGEFEPAATATEGATLLLALYLPDCLSDVGPEDAELYADVLAGIVNEERARNGDAPQVEVSAIPAPQWLTPETLACLRAAAAEAPQPRVLWRGETLLSILAGLADGSRPGHNACTSCADVMARAREVLLALYDAPTPRLVYRGPTLPGVVAPDVCSVLPAVDVPAGTLVALVVEDVADTGEEAEDA